MSTNTPYTESGQAAAAVARSMLPDYDPDGEMSTGERTFRQKRTAQLNAILALIPQAEVDAAALVSPGETREQARDRLAFASEVPMATAA